MFSYFLIYAVLLQLGTTNSQEDLYYAANVIIPEGRQFEYTFESVVSTGTKQPTHFTSELSLKGTLQLKAYQGDEIFGQLKDIKYYLRNGPAVPYHQKKHELHVFIPREVQIQLESPFSFIYDSSGIISGVKFIETDPNWSKDIKKVMVGLFQINMEALDNELDNVNEFSIYGECEVKYQVRNFADNRTTLEKSFDVRKCSSPGSEMASHTEGGSTRNYHITREDGFFRIDSLEARGDLIHTPNGIHDGIYLTGVQTKLVLQKVEILPEMQRLELAMRFEHLYFKNECLQSVNSKINVKAFDSKLSAFVEFYDLNHVTLTKPSVENLTLILDMINDIKQWDKTVLTEYYFDSWSDVANDTIFEKRRCDFFLQLVSYAGTQASAIFIRDLVNNGSIPVFTAVSLIASISKNLNCIDEKFVFGLADFITIGEENDILLGVGVLAFFNLLKRLPEESSLTEKYLQRAYEDFLGTKNYNSKVVYLEALLTIVNDNFTQLEPIIHGETHQEISLRILALWSLTDRFTANPALMEKYIWPILINENLHTDLRLTAYCIYVKTAGANLERFMKLHRLLNREPNEKLYYFHYNTLQALAKLHDDVSDMARIVLRLSRKPIYNNRVEGMYSYVWSDRHFRLHVEYFISIQFNSLMVWCNVASNYGRLFSLYVRAENMRRNRPKLIRSKDDMDLFDYTLVVMRGSDVVLAYGQKGVKKHQILTMLQELINYLGVADEDGIPSQQILLIPSHTIHTFPNDFGLPVTLEQVYPIVQSFRIIPMLDDAIFVKHKILATRHTNIQFLNPITGKAKLSHSIRQTKSVAFQIPLNVKYDWLDSQLTFSVDLETNWDPDNVIGFQNHLQNDVFVGGENASELMDQFNDSSVLKVVTKGNYYRHDFILDKFEIRDIGSTFEASVFDCEDEISRGTFVSKLNEIKSETNIYLPLLKILQYQYNILPTVGGNCGYGLRVTPIKKVNKFEVTLKFATVSTNKDVTVFINATSLVQTCDRDDLIFNKIDLRFLMSYLYDQFRLNLTCTRQVIDDSELALRLDSMLEFDDRSFDAYAHLENGIGIELKGLFSDEQEYVLKKHHITLQECRREHLSIWNGLDPISEDCADVYTTIRKFTINFLLNHELEKSRVLKWLLEKVRSMQRKLERYRITKLPVKNSKNNFKIAITFPLVRRKEVDISWMENGSAAQYYTGIPVKNFLGLKPVNLFPQLEENPGYGFNAVVPIALGIFSIEHLMYDTCIFNSRNILTNRIDKIKTNISFDWNLYYGDSVHEVFAKAISGAEDLIALKIIVKDSRQKIDHLEIHPARNERQRVTFTFKHQDNLLPINPNKAVNLSEFEIWLVSYPSLLRFKHRYIHGVYDGIFINLQILRGNFEKSRGKCLMHRHGNLKLKF